MEKKLDQIVKTQLSGELETAEKEYLELLAEYPDNGAITYRLGVLYLQKGNLQKAVSFLESSLKTQPDNFYAYNFTGISYQESGQLNKAIEYYKKSVKINPDFTEAYNNIAICLSLLNKNEEAAPVMKEALNRENNNPEYHFNMGLIYQKQDLIQQAEKCYLTAVKLKEDYREPVYNLSQLYIANNKCTEAITLINKAINIFHNDFELLFNLAFAYEQREEMTKAEEFYLKVIELETGNIIPYLNLGNVYSKLRDFKNCELMLSKALVIDPENIKLLSNAGLNYHKLSRFEEAIDCYKKILSLEPGHTDTLINYGSTLVELKQFSQGIEKYTQAIELSPHDMTAKFNKAIAHFYTGNFDEGWKFYANRKLPGRDINCDVKNFDWINGNLSGKKILVRMEQGIGDLIQFLNVFSLLKRKGAHTILETRESMMELLGQVNNIDTLCTVDSISEITYDYQIYFMDLVGLLWDELKNNKTKGRYLSASREKLKYWAERFSEYKNMRVGFCWRGNPDHFFDYKRSCSLQEFIPLFKNENISFFSFQKERLTEEEKSILLEYGIFDLSSSEYDLMDSMAALENMDLVITVDTALAHMAGSLDKDVWMMLPFVPDWRWGLEGTKSEWYSSMKYYRQDEQRQWNDVISRVNEDMTNVNNFIRTSFVVDELEKAKVELGKNENSKAKKIYENILSIDKNNSSALFGAAYTSQLLGELETAYNFYSRLLKLDSENIDALNNTSLILRDLRKFEEGEKLIYYAYKLQPDNHNTLNTMALYLEAKGQFAEAKKYFNKAIEINPNYSEAHLNLANILDTETDFPAALKSINRALELDPKNANAHLNKSLIMLKSKDFSRGWDEYEWRKLTPEFPKHNFKKPELTNQDVKDKKIFVYDEQGFGDSLQFIRYVKYLKEAGAYVILYSKKPLKELFSLSLEIDEFYTFGEKPIHEEIFDYHVALLSLPKYFSTMYESIPNDVPYLTVDSEKVELWRKKLNISHNQSKLKVGFVWQGRQPLNNLKRATRLENYIPLFEKVGAEFVCIQKDGIEPSDIEILKSFGIKEYSNELNSFYDTAAIIMNLDIVLSIDTSVSHLSGALGKPTWVLLSTKPDWRWFTEITNSPWYPTARVFRQKELGNWEKVINDVIHELNKLGKKS